MPQAYAGNVVTDAAQIKAGIISDVHINAAADIAESKLDADLSRDSELATHAAETGVSKHIPAAGVANAEIAAGAGIVDTKLAQIATANKVSGAALVSLASIPAGAGVIPQANLPAQVDLVVIARGGDGYPNGATVVLSSNAPAVSFENGATQRWAVSVKVPKTATSITGINLLCYNSTGNAGNVYIKAQTGHHNFDATSSSEEDATEAYAATAMGGAAGQTFKIALPAGTFNGLTNIDEDDLIGIDLFRDATNALDTFETAWILLGIEFVFA